MQENEALQIFCKSNMAIRWWPEKALNYSWHDLIHNTLQLIEVTDDRNRNVLL